MNRIIHSALPFAGIDDIHSSDSLAFDMFCVGDASLMNILEEYLQGTASPLLGEAKKQS